MSIYIMGIDLGTSSVKVSIINGETYEIVDHYTQVTNCELPVDKEGFHEQFVPKIISSLNLCLEKIKQCYRESVSKIGVCGQMHGVMFWKIEGKEKPWKFIDDSYTINQNKVSKLYTWQDARCDQGFLKTLPIPDSHLGISTGFGIPTIFWIKKNTPDLLLEYNRSGLISSFVVAMLCDQEEVYTSYQNAASWGYFNCRDSEWNYSVLETANFPVNILPKLKPGGCLVGKLTQSWYGVPVGVPVGVDLGDLQCSVISTIDTLQDAVINFSTSAQVAFVVKNYTPPSGPPKVTPLSYWPYFNNMYVAVAASLNGGNVLVFFVNMLISWFADLGFIIEKDTVWDTLINLGFNDQANWNLVIKPTCLGERFNPDLTASVTNITGLNLSLGQVFYALCRGLIENLHNQLPSEKLKQSKCNRIVGNGLSLYKNKVLRREIERVYQLPLVFTNIGDASKGAAMAVQKYVEIDSMVSGKELPVPLPLPLPVPVPVPVPVIPPSVTTPVPISKTAPIKPCQCPASCKCNSKMYSKDYSKILH